MTEIKQFTTVWNLYLHRTEKTGYNMVDAMVEYVQAVNSHQASDAALCFGVEQRWLSQSMKIYVGVTLHQFIEQWRILQVLDALDQEPASDLDEVAVRYGFTPGAYFSRVFANVLGFSPLHYVNEQIARHPLYGANESPAVTRAIQKKIRSLKTRYEHPDVAPYFLL